MTDAETSIPPDVAELAKTHAAHAHGLFADSRVKRNLGVIIYDAIVAAISADRSRRPSDEALSEPVAWRWAHHTSPTAWSTGNLPPPKALTPTGETE